MTLGWMSRREPELNLVKPKVSFTKAFLLTCPVVFACFMAGYSRNYEDSFTFAAGSPAQDAVALAYGPFVAKSNKVFGYRRVAHSREDLLDLANGWDLAVKENKLHPLVSVSFEDSPEDGARGEILRAKSILVSGLLKDASDLARISHYNEAASEILLAIRISESLKYSSFNTVYASSVEQKKASRAIQSIASQLDDKTRSEIRAELQAIKANSVELSNLTRYSRTQFYDWLGRMSKTPVSIEDVHRTVLVTNRIAEDPDGKASMRYIRSTGLEDPVDGTNAPEYFSELRRAWASENSNQSLVEELLATL